MPRRANASPGLVLDVRVRLPLLYLRSSCYQRLAPSNVNRKDVCLMTFRTIQISVVAGVLFALSLAPSGIQPAGAEPSAATTKHASATPAADWTFSGCWTRFSSQPCRDIFVDQQGQHWICRACGSTGKPGPGKCDPISQATLNSGLWCS